MSDAKKNEEARQGKSAAAIDALDASEQGSSSAPAAAPAAKPKEKVGLGEDTAKKTARELAAKMKAKIARARAAGNTSLADRLAANRARILKDAGL